MRTVSLSDILDDLHAAEEGMRKFERRYWISSTHFWELYSRGLLDDGENGEDFSEWAAYWKLREKRQTALEQISTQRLESLRSDQPGAPVRLSPAEPVLEIGR